MLQRQLDLQTEELAACRAAEAGGHRRLEEAAASYEELRAAIDVHKKALAQRERTVTELSVQLQTAQARTQEVVQMSTATQQELAAAAEDLAKMTKENQVLGAGRSCACCCSHWRPCLTRRSWGWGGGLHQIVSAECISLRSRLQEQQKLAGLASSQQATAKRNILELQRRLVSSAAATA